MYVVCVPLQTIDSRRSTQMDRFSATAAKLGHDQGALQSGQTVTSTIAVKDIDQLRDILDDGAPPATRSARAAAIKQRYPEAFASDAQGTAKGVLTRAEAYVVGDEPLSQADR